MPLFLRHRANQLSEIMDQSDCDLDKLWLGFGCFAFLLFYRSFIVTDGLRSIRRSYSKTEAEKSVRKNWMIKRYFPYRLLFTYEKDI